MKIYVVTHFYDNGESYEDYREYEDHYYYSTFELASALFWEKAASDYEGQYVLSSVELDTQETECLEKTPYLPCSSQWDKYYAQVNPEPDYEDYDYTPDPTESYIEYWRWEDLCCPTIEEDIPEEEDKAWLEYMTTPGTNYQEWEECERELKERRNAILLDELNTLLEDLC